MGLPPSILIQIGTKQKEGVFGLKDKVLGILRDLGLLLVCSVHVIGLIGVHVIVSEKCNKYGYMSCRDLIEEIILAEDFPQSAFAALLSGAVLLLCILLSKQRLTTLKRILRLELISLLLLVSAAWFDMMYL